MNEIKCPKCGEVFQVDESGYAAILKQVHDSEFDNELCKRLKEHDKANENAVELAVAKANTEKEKKIADLERKISELKGEIELNKTKSESAVDKAVQEKDKTLNLSRTSGSSRRRTSLKRTRQSSSVRTRRSLTIRI